jgi:endonuclease III
MDDTTERSQSDRLLRQLTELQRFYGLLPMPPSDPFALFAWEVLSRRAQPAGRDAALAALRRAHVLTPAAVVRAPRAMLEAAIAPAGPSLELRLDALRAGAEVFRRHRTMAEAIRGPLLSARRSLKRLGQLGAAGAHRMLLFAGGLAIVPVDAHVQRVARRLGYRPADALAPILSGPIGAVGDRPLQRRPSAPSLRDTRRALGSLLGGDVDACRRAFVYLSHHAALTCTERDPHCRVCPLAAECPSAVDTSRHSEI